MPQVKVIATKKTWEIALKKLNIDGVMEVMKDIIVRNLDVSRDDIEFVFEEVVRIVNGAPFQIEVKFSVHPDGLSPTKGTIKTLAADLKDVFALNLSGRGIGDGVSVWIIPYPDAVWQVRILS